MMYSKPACVQEAQHPPQLREFATPNELGSHALVSTAMQLRGVPRNLSYWTNWMILGFGLDMAVRRVRSGVQALTSRVWFNQRWNSCLGFFV